MDGPFRPLNCIDTSAPSNFFKLFWAHPVLILNRYRSFSSSRKFEIIMCVRNSFGLGLQGSVDVPLKAKLHPSKITTTIDEPYYSALGL
jgi:hypothetical protein